MAILKYGILSDTEKWIFIMGEFADCCNDLSMHEFDNIVKLREKWHYNENERELLNKARSLYLKYISDSDSVNMSTKFYLEESVGDWLDYNQKRINDKKTSNGRTVRVS